MFRKPTHDERRLLRELLRLARFEGPADWLELLEVQNMDDGGMGSLELRPHRRRSPNSTFGRQLAAVQFTDVDGVEVVASLNADAAGEPFELDVWKTDSRALVKIGESFRPLDE